MSIFGGSNDEVTVTIRAKDEASGVINNVEKSAGGLWKQFAIGTYATRGIDAAFRVLSTTVTDSLREFEEHETVVAQTNAVLKSTGQAAGLSAEEIVKMADSLSKVTLFSDEAILSGQNLLLTFMNIGKDVFPEATQAMVDMSQAMGQDLKSSAIQMGKALNNPIEGLSALSRVGVAFTPIQEEMIRSMVKAGNVAGAQKIILKELNAEFGGSAKSAFEAASSITILQKNMAEAKEEIGRGLTPVVNSLFTAFGQLTGGMGENANISKTVFRVTSGVVEVVVNATVAIYEMAAAVVYLSSYIAQASLSVMNFDSDVRESFSNFRKATAENMATARDFSMNLIDSNNKIEESWDESKLSSEVAGKAAVSAFSATAAEAEKAAKKIQEANDAVAETEKKITELRMGLLNDLTNSKEDFARAYVTQEEKVRDLKSQIKDSEDTKDKQRLQSEYEREKQALENAAVLKTTFEAQILEERRRNRLTDFEREVEDINKRNLMAELEYTKKLIALQQELLLNKQKSQELIAIEQTTTDSVVAEVQKREDAVVKSVDKIYNKYTLLSDAVNSVFSSGFVGSAGKAKTSSSMLPRFEHGGIVPGARGTAVPIVAHGQEQIIPAGQSRRGGGNNINVVLNYPVIKSKDDISLIRQQIEQAFRGITRDNKLSTI